MRQGETYLYPETLEPYSGPVFEVFPENPSKIEFRFTLKDGERDGLYEEYYDNGQLFQKGTYKDGESDGPFESYNNNGNIIEKWRIYFSPR